MSIFTVDILDTHRLAHSPLYHETALAGNNADPYHIKGIVPIFIQSVYAKSEHVTFTCNGFDTSKSGMCIHHPGLVGDMGVGPKGLQKIDSASALVLSCSLAPERYLPDHSGRDQPAQLPLRPPADPLTGCFRRIFQRLSSFSPPLPISMVGIGFKKGTGSDDEESAKKTRSQPD